MRHIISSIAIALSVGLFASCGNGKKQMAEAEENCYGINYSDTSTIKKAHKNVLILSGSPRRGGNTDLLCDEFARGAKEAGARVESCSWETMISGSSRRWTSVTWATVRTWLRTMRR